MSAPRRSPLVPGWPDALPASGGPVRWGSGSVCRARPCSARPCSARPCSKIRENAVGAAPGDRPLSVAGENTALSPGPVGGADGPFGYGGARYRLVLRVHGSSQPAPDDRSLPPVSPGRRPSCRRPGRLPLCPLHVPPGAEVGALLRASAVQMPHLWPDFQHLHGHAAAPSEDTGPLEALPLVRRWTADRAALRGGPRYRQGHRVALAPSPSGSMALRVPTPAGRVRPDGPLLPASFLHGEASRGASPAWSRGALVFDHEIRRPGHGARGRGAQAGSPLATE